MGTSRVIVRFEKPAIVVLPRSQTNSLASVKNHWRHGNNHQASLRADFHCRNHRAGMNFSRSCSIYIYKLGIVLVAQWLERRTSDRQVAGSSPGSRSERREIIFFYIYFLINLFFLFFNSELTLISVSVPSPCYRSST